MGGWGGHGSGVKVRSRGQSQCLESKIRSRVVRVG